MSDRSASEAKMNVPGAPPIQPPADVLPPSSEGARPPTQPAELNLRICASLVRYVREQHGASGLAKAAEAAGLAPADLDGRNRWVAADTVEALLAHVRGLVPDDDAFKAACAYQLRKALGPLGAALWATTPLDIHMLAFRNVGLVSRISRYEPIVWSPTSLEVRYVSERRESRLMCLLRHAQGTALPTLWGLPPGQLREGKCIARGDDACEYRWRFYRTRHWGPLLVGLVAGGAAAGVVAWLAPPGAAVIALPMAGALLGAFVDQRRRLRANLQVGEEIIRDLRDAAIESAESRLELVEMQQRERQWTRLVEEQLAEKTRLLQEAVATVRGDAQQRVSVLREFSHDLRNPLQVLLANVAQLQEGGGLDDDAARPLDELAAAAAQLEQLTQMLITAAATEGATVVLDPKPLVVMPMVDKLRKRLAALAHSKGLRTMVFPTRDAPESIETDRLVFDRVIDNLFSNAVKYTDHGSIAVEIGGTPGHLTIKVSDTGVGIAPEKLEQVFRPGGSRQADRAPGSHGLGLSVVVSLLHQIGGRLEVLSKPSGGTTFWAHFPEKVRPPSEPERAEPTRMLRRVVHIRRSSTA